MSRLVLPSELSRAALEDIVSTVQGLLYLDLGHDDREFWNPAKDRSSCEVCRAIQERLQRHGLVPGEEQDCTPPATAHPAMSTADLVAWAQSQGLSPEDLDDEIHDQVAGAASNLNNRGLSAQIEFLVQQFGAAETQKLLTDLVSDNAPCGTTS